MNAIGGIFYKKKHISDVEKNHIALMMKELGKYSFEDFGEFQEKEIYLGCYINRVVPESKDEILPYEDAQSGLVIVSDAIIDNRKELCDLLRLKDTENLPDSKIILEAFRVWGKECTEKLVGDFAFAIWDSKKQQLFCARDHVGKRTLYYYDCDEFFVFSTLIEPMFQIEGVKKALNDTYIGDFLSLPSVMSQVDAEITVYDKIYQLPPAGAMIINSEKVTKWTYWEIKEGTKFYFDTDEECQKAFMEVFSEAVRCRMRSNKKIGVMLSGGLDSTSVAAIAARELKKKNEMLYGFTQVPMEGYQEWLPEKKLADEREYVEALCEFAGNVIPNYVDSKGHNSITEINEKIKIIEQPYKTLENSHWMHEILRVAKKNDIGMLLDGQSGNATISWGNYSAYLRNVSEQEGFTRCLEEIKKYSKVKNIKKLRLARSILMSYLPYELKKIKYFIKGGVNHSEKLCPINKEFYESMKVKKRFKEHKIDTLFIDQGNSFSRRYKLLNPKSFSHLGAMETKMSLATGVCRRDPTRDKRVIEFCMGIEEKYWVKDGLERRLIRAAAEGILPDKIRLNTTKRGKQAADWIQRISGTWESIWSEIDTIGDFSLENKYLDIKGIKERLNRNKTIDTKDGNNSDIRFLIRALIFSRFLRSNF